jgi:phage shock protein C
MKKLTRNPDNKQIAGVCSGLADYFGLDATLVRLLVAIGTLMSVGTGIIAYGVAWILMPERPTGVVQPPQWPQNH